MKIGELTITTIARLVQGLLREHLERLNQAWINAGESDLKISLSATLKSGKNGNLDQEVKISYVVDKEEDTAKASVNEKQTVLFDEKSRPCYLRPDTDVFENVCNKCDSRIDLIFVTGDSLPRIIKDTSEIPTPLGHGQMLQFYVCPSWADEYYKEWCDFMVAKEIEPPPKIIINKKNGKKNGGKK